MAKKTIVVLLVGLTLALFRWAVASVALWAIARRATAFPIPSWIDWQRWVLTGAGF
jgi:hypothetical protein